MQSRINRDYNILLDFWYNIVYNIQDFEFLGMSFPELMNKTKFGGAGDVDSHLYGSER